MSENKTQKNYLWSKNTKLQRADKPDKLFFLN